MAVNEPTTRAEDCLRDVPVKLECQEALTNEKRSSLASAAELLGTLGVRVDLNLPSRRLWLEAARHQQSATVHLISQGVCLLALKARTRQGEWLQTLKRHRIDTRRAQEATGVARWLIEGHTRISAPLEKLLRLEVSKLILLSRISWDAIESYEVDLDTLISWDCQRLSAEITRLNRQSMSAVTSKAAWRAVEKDAHAALRTVIGGYQDFANAVVELAPLAEGLHGNARRGVIRRLQARHEATNQQVAEIAKTVLTPAWARLQGDESMPIRSAESA